MRRCFFHFQNLWVSSNSVVQQKFGCRGGVVQAIPLSAEEAVYYTLEQTTMTNQTLIETRTASPSVQPNTLAWFYELARKYFDLGLTDACEAALRQAERRLFQILIEKQGTHIIDPQILVSMYARLGLIEDANRVADRILQCIRRRAKFDSDKDKEFALQAVQASLFACI